MRSFTRMAMAALVASFVVTSARADDEDVAIDKIPAAILKTVKAKFPTAKINKASKEVEEGKTVYELEMTDGGKSLDVNFTPEGKILVIEREIAVEKLPKVVSAAVAKKYPKGKITKAEEVTEGDEVSYEVMVKVGDKVRALEVEADGDIESDEEVKD